MDDAKKPNRLKRWSRRLGKVLLALVVLGVVADQIAVWQLQKAIDDEVAAIDATDPGWRMADIQAARQALPDGENSTRYYDLIKFNGRIVTYRQDAVDGLTAGYLPTKELLRDLRKSLDAIGLFETDMAREIAYVPRGRFLTPAEPDNIWLRIGRYYKLSDLATLLTFDALLRAADGDGDGALHSCRAALNVGEMVYDEPDLDAQRCRGIIWENACRAVERTLGLAEPSPDALAATQAAFARVEPLPRMLIGARGERAKVHDNCLGMIAGTAPPYQRYPPPMKFEWLDQQWIKRYDGRYDHARRIRDCTEVISFLKLPEASLIQQSPAIKVRFEKLIGASGLHDAYDQEYRLRAELRCHVTMLAAERYRRTRGNFPVEAEQLVPDLLPKLYTDPFDGKPLRWKRDGEKLAVYSVGHDLADDGGNMNRALRPLYEHNTDFGGVVWDVSKRRQPAPPPKPDEP